MIDDQCLNVYYQTEFKTEKVKKKEKKSSTFDTFYIFNFSKRTILYEKNPFLFNFINIRNSIIPLD